ncbi:MAG TPA: hypothetical protein VFA26_02445 [Gemmataceae bacterium]|nr:hypothetical protein [Gemmataceae bacterium]
MRRSSARLFLVRLWRDDSGALIATEFVMAATLLVLGTVAGLVAVRDATNSGLTEFADAVRSVRPSYQFSGNSNGLASTGGSAYSPVRQPAPHGGLPQPSFFPQPQAQDEWLGSSLQPPPGVAD